jgi:hypothetical protein
LSLQSKVKNSLQRISSLKIPFILAIVIVVLIAAGLAAIFIRLNQTLENNEIQSNEIQVELPRPESAEGRFLFNGTIFWGRGIEKWSMQTDGTYDYARPFSGLDTFEPEKYDAWAADHECPVLDIVIPFQTQVDNLVFNCRPEYLPEAVKYFQLINLANNHSGDQGQDGFLETRQRFTDAGAQVFGNYDPSIKEDICEVVSLPVRLQVSDGTEAESALPVAFCAWHYFGRSPLEGEIEHLKQYAEIMPVFAFVHMGTEYLTEATPFQQDIARRVIDAGAEFVIANNPHWVQNTEVYDGKLIVYSTGNFIFDQLDTEGMRSASVDVGISTPYDENLAQWIDLAKDCKQLQDDCLQQAQEQGLSRYQLEYEFDVVAGDNTNRLTKKADDTVQAFIERRMNWEQTLEELRGL